MSILGKIGKIAMTAAPFAAMAIPGVGPLVGGVMKGAGIGGKLATAAKFGSALAPVLGSAAKGQAQGKQVQAGQDMQRDRLALDRYKTEQAAPELRRRSAVNASMTANRQPVKMSRDASGHRSVSGGFANPDLINPDTKALSEDMTHQAMLQQLQHGADIPKMTPAPKSGFMDKLLGGGAMAASIFGALPGMGRKPTGGIVPPVMNETEDTEYS